MKTEIYDQTDQAKRLNVSSTKTRGLVVISIDGVGRTVKASELKAATDVAARNPED